MARNALMSAANDKSVVELLPSEPLAKLLAIMRCLRDPEQGCPWDLQQTHASIAHYAIEEAYELEAAIQTDDIEEIKSELGDLLLQVVFHAQMAAEQNRFSFNDVAASIAEKMLRRHPHVFSGSLAPEIGADGVKQNWEQIKTAERAARGQTGLLDDVAVTLPGMLRAMKLQKRAAKVGFDWDDPQKVIEKIHEELDELSAEIADNQTANIEDELGDVLFAVANLARHLKINPENAIKSTNAKFIRRFQYIEQNAGSAALETLSLEALEALWQQAKDTEKSKS